MSHTAVDWKHGGNCARAARSGSSCARFAVFFRCLFFHAAALALACSPACAQTAERILLDATINGKSARLGFDTGASDFILFPKGAARLGISFTNPPENILPEHGQIPVGKTEECEVAIGDSKIRTSFKIVKIPSMLPVPEDGLVGWGPIRRNIVMIDALSGVVTSLTNVPPEARAWTKLRLRSNSSIVRLEWLSPGEKPLNIAVDTGSPQGVKLPPEKWQAWKAAHTNQPRTLIALHNQYAGLVITEEAWARELSLGSLLLADVPVTQADPGDIALGSAGYEGTIGLWALKRLHLIIDGKENIAYLKSRTTPPPVYQHNRLGAVFTPADLATTTDLIARVVESSPAYDAGIRDGDVLLRIGELEVTKWRTDPAVLPLGRFWERPAGTELELMLRRGDKTLKVRAVLRQILSPDSASQ